MPSLFPLIENLTTQAIVEFPKNKILRDDKGREQRIIPHQSPLRTYNLTKKILIASEVNALYSLFDTMKGAQDTFLYQDKSDYEATRLPKALSAGVYTQGVIIQSGSVYQLCKKYVCGDNIHYRPIYYVDTLTIYDSNSNIVSGWTFILGGQITGLSGSGYTATFTFQVPVHFQADRLENVISASKNSSGNTIYSLNDVILKEDRKPISLILTDTFNDYANHTFQIDFLFRSTLSKRYATQKVELESGYDSRITLQDDGITEIDFGERTQLIHDQLEYLLCVWLNTKGCGAFFNFEDSTNTSVVARFDNIPLAYTRRTPLPHDKYEVKGLKARLFYEAVLTDTGYNGWTGPVLTLCDCIKIEVPPPTVLQQFQFEFDIRADYYGGSPAEDILDGSYGGRNDLPWLRQGRSGQFVGYTMQVFFDEGDGGGGWVYYFLRVMIDGVNVTPGGVWYRVSQFEQKKAFTGIRSGILNPRAVNITAVPV